MTLALLLTAATGAWADEELTETIITTGYSGSNLTVNGTYFKVSGTQFRSDGGYNGVRIANGKTATISLIDPNSSAKATKIVLYPDGGDTDVQYVKIDGAGTYSSTDVTVSKDVSITNDGSATISWGGNVNYGVSISKIEITYTAGPVVNINDAKTEAWFNMPASDATVNYELVRDMQDETNPVAFSVLPSSGNIVVKKGSDGKYQPAEALTIQLIDPLAAAEAQNIIAADGITVKVLVGAENGQGAIDYDQDNPITLEAFLADMKPGYYWIKAEPTDENSPYDGTVYSSQFTVVEQYDLTVKPANDFSKGKIDAVTVGSETVTPDATTGKVTKTGIAPDTEVKLKAKRGYVIEKVEVKKPVIPMLNAATTENIGMVVCNKGHLHDAKTAVPDGCTAVGILSKVTGTGHGLILALSDATSQTWNTINGWASASYAGTTLKVLPDADARGTNLTSYTTLGETTVSDWAVAQKSDYEAIFTNLGSTTGDTDGYTYDGNVNAYITTGVGGTAITGVYWSATFRQGNICWSFDYISWGNYNKTDGLRVRPVLGF